MRRVKEQLLPFLLWFPLVNRKSLRDDMFAGLTGAVVVLPQGVAFAIIAGLPPQIGLYTAMVPPIIAALFGSSRHLVSGPTTAISIVLFSTISRHVEPGSPEFIGIALTLTLMSGIIQLAAGLLRMGMLVNFVSHTVVIGFAAGAGILIGAGQLEHALGIHLPQGESFLHTLIDLWVHRSEAQLPVFVVAFGTLLVAVLSKRFFPKLPHLLISLLAGTGLAQVFGGEAAGIAMVGEIPASLPPLSLPNLSISTIKEFTPEAIAIALLGLISSVSNARSVATKSHQRIDANQEFIGTGLSNIVGAFFSSFSACGSFTRSGLNFSAGAKTPFAAVFASVFLMAVVMLIAPYVAYLPIPAMAGVILLVSYDLVDVQQFRHIMESSKTETAVLLVTLGATLFLELEFAIYLGMLVSLMIFLGYTSYPDIVTLAPDVDPRYGKKTLADVSTRPLLECPQLKIIRVDMSIYFGSVNHLQAALRRISAQGINHILIMGSGINRIDLSGAEVLHHEAERLEALGGGLYFAELKPRVYESISRTHLIKYIGNNHFFDEKKEAMRVLQRLLRKQGRCEGCTRLVFDECKTMPKIEKAPK